MTTSHTGTGRPFNRLVAHQLQSQAEVSAAGGTTAHHPIRRCPHGMLVTTACMLGPLACAARPHRSGPIVILQSCSVEHVPIGSARWIVPISDKTTYMSCGIGLNKASGTAVPCRIGYGRSRAGPTAFVESEDRSPTTRPTPVESKRLGAHHRYLSATGPRRVCRLIGRSEPIDFVNRVKSLVESAEKHW
jgi:hypothetical protein